MLNDNAKTANNVCRCSGMDLKHCAKSWQPGLLFAFTAFCPLLHSVEDFFHGLPCCLGWHAWRSAGLFVPDKLICLCKCGGSLFGCHGFHPCQCDVRFFAEPLHQNGVWTSATFAEQLTCAQTGHTLLLVLQGFHTAQVAESSSKPGQVDSAICICQLCLLVSQYQLF